MEKAAAIQDLRKFLLANVSTLKPTFCAEELESLQTSLYAPLAHLLSQLDTTHPSNITELKLLQWQDLPPAERVLALRLLLWGHRGKTLSQDTLNKLAATRELTQSTDSPELLLCSFLLSALVGPSADHNSRVEDFISQYRGNGSWVESALMSLQQATQPVEFYSALPLSNPACRYEFFRAVLSFRLTQPECLQRALDFLYSFVGTTYLDIAVKDIGQIHILLDGLCVQVISQSELSSTQKEVLYRVLAKFMQCLDSLLASDVADYNYLPQSLIDVIRSPTLLPLDLVTPFVSLLFGASLFNHPLVEVVAVRLEQSGSPEIPNVKLMKRIAKKNPQYRLLACRLLGHILAHSFDAQEQLTAISILGQFAPGSAERVFRAMNRAATAMVAEISLECEEQAVEVPQSFASFVGEIARMLDKRLVAEPKPSEKAGPATSSLDYSQTLLKSIWQTSGVFNYQALMNAATDNAFCAIHYYAEIFSRLKNSVLVEGLSNPSVHPVVHYFAGSQLIRVFQLNLPAELTGLEPPAEPNQPKALLDMLEQEFSHFQELEEEIRLIPEEYFDWLEPILNSHLVIDTYVSLGLDHQNIRIIVGKAYFVPLARSHGITISNGVVLVRSDYGGSNEGQRCGLVITLIHEFAHYCRRMKGGFYNPNCLTPTRDGEDDESYKSGDLGDKNPQSRKHSSSEAKHGEGGFQVEEMLFGLVPTHVNEYQARFLLNRCSWQYDKEDFRKQLKSLGKKKTGAIYMYPRDCSGYDFPRYDLEYVD